MSLHYLVKLSVRVLEVNSNGVPAEPKREMALCRHMWVSRPSGLSWAVLVVDISDSGGPQT